MRFLRLTKSGMEHDHTTWFRRHFFGFLGWSAGPDDDGEAHVNMHVTILRDYLGRLDMRVDHKPGRAWNHSAPTTHLYFGNAVRMHLEGLDLTGHTIRLTRDDDEFLFEIE